MKLRHPFGRTYHVDVLASAALALFRRRYPRKRRRMAVARLVVKIGYDLRAVWQDDALYAPAERTEASFFSPLEECAVHTGGLGQWLG